jgi:hypothetical protein
MFARFALSGRSTRQGERLWQDWSEIGLDVYKRKLIIFLVLLTYQLVIYLVQARGAASSY